MLTASREHSTRDWDPNRRLVIPRRPARLCRDCSASTRCAGSPAQRRLQRRGANHPSVQRTPLNDSRGRPIQLGKSGLSPEVRPQRKDVFESLLVGILCQSLKFESHDSTTANVRFKLAHLRRSHYSAVVAEATSAKGFWQEGRYSRLVAGRPHGRALQCER